MTVWRGKIKFWTPSSSIYVGSVMSLSAVHWLAVDSNDAKRNHLDCNSEYKNAFKPIYVHMQCFFRSVLSISKFLIMGIWFNFVFYKLESVSSIDNLELMSKYLDVSKHPAVHLLVLLSVAWHGWLLAGTSNIPVDIATPRR